jgi:hypothetical protein
MTNDNEVIIIAEEANGETKVVEIVATDADALLGKDADGDSLIEEVFEAFLDPTDDFDSHQTGQGTDEVSDADVLNTPAGYTVSELNADENTTDAAFDTSLLSADANDFEVTGMNAGFDDDSTGYVTAGADTSFAAIDSTEAHTTDHTTANSESEVNTETQANFDLATEAQGKADEAIAAGDYEAAAQYREDAEHAAWQAGDDSMLHGSNANDLTMADYYQDKAADLEHQQSEYAAAGNYEAARDASRDAATYTHWGDNEAGGADHSAEAQHEYGEMDMASWQQNIADGYQHDADVYAAQGDVDHAEMYQQEANDHQGVADYYGELGQHDGVYDQYDSVPDASYGGYDYSTDASQAVDYSSTTDYSSYDSE